MHIDGPIPDGTLSVDTLINHTIGRYCQSLHRHQVVKTGILVNILEINSSNTLKTSYEQFFYGTKVRKVFVFILRQPSTSATRFINLPQMSLNL